MFEEQRKEYIRYLQDAMREIREEAGMSQEDFAERMDCSATTIHRYESGKSIPSFDTLFLFAALMNVPLERLTPDYRAAQSALEQQTRFSLLTNENKQLVISTMNTLINGLIDNQLKGARNRPN